MTEAIKKRWYLAGPMTGYPKFNFPMFDTVAAGLRSVGYDIVSPAELDAGPVREAALKSEHGLLDDIPAAHSYGTLLSRDVRIVIDECQGILLLPHWEKSRGARLEAFVGILCGHEFKTVGLLHSGDVIHSLALLPGDRDEVLRCLAKVPDVLEDYRHWINARWAGQYTSRVREVSIVGLGLGGEAGECQEYFKKYVRDSRDLHTEKLKLELGDLLHYTMRAIELAGFTPQEVIEANKVKLTGRDAHNKTLLDVLSADGRQPTPEELQQNNIPGYLTRQEEQS